MGKDPGYFNEVKLEDAFLWRRLDDERPLTELGSILRALDFIHIKTCLLDHYNADYPVVEPRELIPSFDAPLIEYKHLPAFSMVVFDRPLSYQDEGFQFDLLAPEGRPPDPALAAANRNIIKQRVPRNLVGQVDQVLGRRAPTPLSRYLDLLPMIAEMDRAHVMARQEDGCFHLAGIFASLPSDLDGEIKRFGRRIGKFTPGDNQQYAGNRHFVYRFYMEQSGFAICGERHTSAALFARRLLRRGETFAIKVLGTSDRTLSCLSSIGAHHGMPSVEKTALSVVRADDPETIAGLGEGGFFVDPRRRVVILKVRYAQHRYHPDNVLEERALSVAGQQVVHPVTGELRHDVDVLGLSQDRLLMLNDIVRGEHHGTILYQGRDKVKDTTSTLDRLKFLAAWLQKHHSILADYSPDNFARVKKVIRSYLEDPEYQAEFERYQDMYREVREVAWDLRVSHRLRLLEKLARTRSDGSGRKLKHVQILTILVHILGQEGPELIENNPKALQKLLRLCRRHLESSYLKTRYLSRPPKTPLERETVGEYRLLAALVQRLEDMQSQQEAAQAELA